MIISNSSGSTSINSITTKLAHFKVGVDNVIFSVDTEDHRLLVLLIKRSEKPELNKWSLPGTLVREGESLEAAAYRILAEKIKAKNLYLEQLYTFADSARTPGENSTSYGERYLSISYFALVRFEDIDLISATNATQWYQVKDVPQLSFNHNKILKYGYQRLKNKLEYSPIAFDVLPEKFTLNEVYQLYCTVLGDHFSDYSNFRAKLLKLKILTDTGLKSYRGAGRPASLYQFDAAAFAPLKDKPMVFI